MIKKLAEKITCALFKSKNDLSDLQKKTICFGMECALNETSKMLVFLLLSLIFSVTGNFLVTVLFYCTYRAFSGGFHNKTYWGCFFTSLVQFSVVISIGEQLDLMLPGKLAIVAVSAATAAIYAPVDHLNKPIISTARRSRAKLNSILAASILGMVGLFLPGSLSVTALLAVFAQSLTLPVGYYYNRRTAYANAQMDKV